MPSSNWQEDHVSFAMGSRGRQTWLNQSGRINAPLLFDPGLQHKLAYTAIVHPLDLPGADLAITKTADAASVLSEETSPTPRL